MDFQDNAKANGGISSHGKKPPPSSLPLKERIDVRSFPTLDSGGGGGSSCGDSLMAQATSLHGKDALDSNGSGSLRICSASAESSNLGFADATRRGSRPLSETSFPSATLSSSGRSSDGDAANNGHVPSYIGISCAISGYGNYSRYCVAATRISLSRGSSPTVAKLSEGQPFLASDFSTPLSKPPASSKLIAKPNSAPAGGHSHNRLSMDATPMKDETDTDIEASLSSKSLVQKRIESLYGSSAGTDWRESRSKLKTPTSSSCSKEKFRSPSCPPTKATSCSSPLDALKSRHSYICKVT